jgi:hypothetical protein
MKGGAAEGRRGRSSWGLKGTRSWAAKEDRRGRTSWGLKGTRSAWAAKEDRQGKSRLDMRGTRRWAAKVDSAQQASLEESAQLRKGLRLTSPSTRLGTTADAYSSSTILP